MKLYPLFFLAIFSVTTPLLSAKPTATEPDEHAAHQSMETTDTASSTNESAAVNETAVSETAVSEEDENPPAPTATTITENNLQDLLTTMQNIVKTMANIADQLAKSSQAATMTMTMPTDKDKDKESSEMVMSPLQARKQDLNNLLKQIEQASDPATRQPLLKAHLAKMQETLEVLNIITETGQMMIQMSSPGQAGGKMDMDMDMGSSSGDQPEKKKECKMMKMKDDMKMSKGSADMDMEPRQALLEQRLEGIQLMLNQLLQHQMQVEK